MTLRDLQYRQAGKIIAVHGESDTAVRLQSLGVLPGCRVSRVNTALLGDPIAYLIDDEKISIRLADAEVVEIELI